MPAEGSLEELVETFAESRASRNARYLDGMRCAVRWFRRVVGSSFVHDLHPSNIDRLVVGALRSGVSACYVDQLAERIMTLWRFSCLQRGTKPRNGIAVYVIKVGSRRALQLRYRDPVTGRKVSRSAGTQDRSVARQAASEWQRQLIGDQEPSIWPDRRRRKDLYARSRAKSARRRQGLKLHLPESMVCLGTTVRVDRNGRAAEPEIVLPTFDGAVISANAPETVTVNHEKYSRYRKRW